MDQAFLDEGAEHPVLGPHYFAARAAAETFMARFELEHFKPLIEKFASDFRDKMWGDIETFLLCDVENNLQGTMWRQIDDSVKALLSGERWALERYALGTKYECEKIRIAIAKHIPEELQNARVKELEEENERLRKDLEWARRR